VLKQEIHVLRARITEKISRSVTLDREHVVIERLDADHNPTGQSEKAGEVGTVDI
jgi:stress response protein YsnF